MSVGSNTVTDEAAVTTLHLDRLHISNETQQELGHMECQMNCGFSEAYLTNRTISVVENFDHTHSVSSSQKTECGYRNNTRTVLDKCKCLH